MDPLRHAFELHVADLHGADLVLLTADIYHCLADEDLTEAGAFADARGQVDRLPEVAFFPEDDRPGVQARMRGSTPPQG